MNIQIIAALIGVAGILIGVWIGGIMSTRTAMKAIRRQEFNRAAAVFRSAFIKEQRLLSHGSFIEKTGLSACDIIKAAIDRHEKAMIRFGPFLCKAKVDEYEKAWKDYAGDSKHFEQYSGGGIIKSQDKRTLALSHINLLLEFADPKNGAST